MDQGMIPPQMGTVTDDDRLWALLSWLLTPLIPIIVLLMQDKKVRPFIKYNAIQALIIGVANLVISSLLSFVVIGCVIAFAVIILQIVFAVQSYQGKWVTIPFVTDFAKSQNWI